MRFSNTVIDHAFTKYKRALCTLMPCRWCDGEIGLNIPQLLRFPVVLGARLVGPHHYYLVNIYSVRLVRQELQLVHITDTKNLCGCFIASRKLCWLTARCGGRLPRPRRSKERTDAVSPGPAEKTLTESLPISSCSERAFNVETLPCRSFAAIRSSLFLSCSPFSMPPGRPSVVVDDASPSDSLRAGDFPPVRVPALTWLDTLAVGLPGQLFERPPSERFFAVAMVLADVNDPHEGLLLRLASFPPLPTVSVGVLLRRDPGVPLRSESWRCGVEGAETAEDDRDPSDDMKLDPTPLIAWRSPFRLNPSGVHGPRPWSKPNRVSVSAEAASVEFICRWENSIKQRKEIELENGMMTWCCNLLLLQHTQELLDLPRTFRWQCKCCILMPVPSGVTHVLVFLFV